MSARHPRLAALLALALLLSACGGEDAAGDGAAAPGGPAAASAPADTGLNPSVTVDTQATPGDTTGPAGP